MKPGRIPTIRSRLVLLVVACLIPATLMAAALIAANYQRERARLVRDNIATARAMTSALDRELAGVRSALFALATSPHLAADDLRAFHTQAQEVLPVLIASNLVLTDESGQQRLNTLRPYGDALPSVHTLHLDRIFATGRPVISDLFLASVMGRPLVAIGVPVRRGNTVAYSLTAGIPPERLSGILTQQHLPADWIATIFDSKGTIVSRTHDMDRFLGKPGAPELIERIGEVHEDSLDIVTLDGIPALSVFSRSAVSNWTVAISIPTRGLTGELRQSLGWVVLGLAILFLGSVAMAWFIGGRIARSVRGLSGPALALASGETVSVLPLHLKEADDVGNALAMASTLLIDARRRSHHDALTGLANRILFDEIVDHQLALCARTGSPLAVLYLDLDGFKSVNDTHGHATGDALLRAVAARITGAIRASDLAARLGGDEFAVVLVNAGMDEAKTVAAKMTEAVSMPYPLGPLTIGIAASIGIAVYPESGTTSETLLHCADLAMYRAKPASRRKRDDGQVLEAA